MSAQMITDANATILLNRLMAIKESGQNFYLVLDSFRQSSYYIIQHMIHENLKQDLDILYVSFETISRPSYATEYIDCIDISGKTLNDKIGKILKSRFGGSIGNKNKAVLMIDSLNFIKDEELSEFMQMIYNVDKNIIVIGTFHLSYPVRSVRSLHLNYPRGLEFLKFVASSIFEVLPLDYKSTNEEEKDFAEKYFGSPCHKGSNSYKYVLKLVVRKKSGRSVRFKYVVDSLKYVSSNIQDSEDEDSEYEIESSLDASKEEDLLKGLTTFRLSTTAGERKSREEVELPYMEAQSEGGRVGGAIVYEFEKDDDYDEEDAFEDPF
ncbi:Elongator subunit IKI1 ASCRUDRAFT_9192 [Ascoidea rubescens DSM 1968]|uniref:Elongator complex protein 5 n=1 Tax=Ascoidea rubescens DSM 1968 TaxID=1344418 RepID=A0A1D2VCT9_9ASCO|nr:hypothetical protein ASCRUDRAFT_9192 [Ascoidea rubescens DSM 1968]ODV59508.1 hypothetical protein ASCRUDRAFT_9192 [Ascoidea rubescens DSM 1968]